MLAEQSVLTIIENSSREIIKNTPGIQGHAVNPDTAEYVLGLALDEFQLQITIS